MRVVFVGNIHILTRVVHRNLATVFLLMCCFFVMYITGCGETDQSKETPDSTKIGSWSALPDGPVGRSDHMAFVHKGKVFFLGGHTEDDNVSNETHRPSTGFIEIYNLDNEAWSRSSENISLQSCDSVSKPSVHQVGTKLVGVCTSSELTVFDMETLEFSSIEYSDEIGDKFALVVPIGRRLYFVEDLENGRAGELDPDNGTWTARTSPGRNIVGNELNPRRFVWTGEKIFGFGGVNGDKYFEKAILLNPEDGTYTDASTENHLSSRIGYSMLWTGEKIAIWGGRKGNDYLNDGAFFDPATNIWSPFQSTGITPPTRAGHKSAWVDDILLIWGGYSKFNGEATIVGDGYAYNPVEKQWQRQNCSNECNNQGPGLYQTIIFQEHGYRRTHKRDNQ